jgi:hypothetical protein
LEDAKIQIEEGIRPTIGVLPRHAARISSKNSANETGNPVPLSLDLEDIVMTSGAALVSSK